MSKDPFQVANIRQILTPLVAEVFVQIHSNLCAKLAKAGLPSSTLLAFAAVLIYTRARTSERPVIEMLDAVRRMVKDLEEQRPVPNISTKKAANDVN